MQYPKTENLLRRDEETHVCYPRLRRPEFGLIDRWHVTQKIDGMNIRIRLDDPPGDEGGYGERHSIYGRSDKAQIPGDLVQRINELLPDSYDSVVFPREDVWLFGEGYGAGIQKGGHYREDKSFILFDVRVRSPGGPGRWLSWDEVSCLGDFLGLDTVPVLGTDVPRDQLGTYALGGYHNIGVVPLGDRDNFEGVVATTQPPLFFANGDRVKTKIKRKDMEAAIEAHGSSAIARAE